MDFNVSQITTMLVEFATTFGLRLVAGLALLLIGLRIVKYVVKLAERMLQRNDVDATLRPFLRTLVSTLLKALLVITSLGVIGIEMTSFIAVLGAAGLAIGMALSGTLQNFAGGVVILVLRPFKKGDFIEAQGYMGFVDEIQIFHTTITTTDNRTVIIPNGSLSTDSLINYTREPIRRVDLTFGISYGDSTDKARETLMRIASDDERILADPPVRVFVEALADSSVNLTARVWCKTDDYWDLFFAMNERVYNEFPQNGLNFPFPQMDVHLKKTES